ASFRESSLVSTFIFASVFRPRLERRAEIGRGKDAQFMDGGQRKPRRWSRLRGEAVRQHHAAGQRRGSRGGQGSSLSLTGTDFGNIPAWCFKLISLSMPRCHWTAFRRRPRLSRIASVATSPSATTRAFRPHSTWSSRASRRPQTTPI